MSILTLRYQSGTMEAYDVNKGQVPLGTLRLFLNLGDYRSSGEVVDENRNIHNWNKGWFGGINIDPSCPNKEEFKEVIGRFV